MASAGPARTHHCNAVFVSQGVFPRRYGSWLVTLLPPSVPLLCFVAVQRRRRRRQPWQVRKSEIALPCVRQALHVQSMNTHEYGDKPSLVEAQTSYFMVPDLLASLPLTREIELG